MRVLIDIYWWDAEELIEAARWTEVDKGWTDLAVKIRRVLRNEKVLPLLIGTHPKLDKLIFHQLKGDEIVLNIQRAPYAACESGETGNSESWRDKPWDRKKLPKFLK